MKAKTGGRRPGAGRKPVKDKKKALTIYVAESVIKANGGPDKARITAISALTN